MPVVRFCRSKASDIEALRLPRFARRANQRRPVFLSCPALIEKIFLFFRNQIRCTPLAVPFPSRGVSQSSRTLGAGCDGRGSAQTYAPPRGRQNRVVLTPRRRRQALSRAGDGDKKARSPGRARNKLLKPLRREGWVIPV